MNWVDTQMLQAAIGTGDPVRDCWHFISIVQREVFNIDLPDFSEDHANILPDFIVAQTQSQWQQIDEDDIHEGDLCIVNKRKMTPHIGVITPDGGILHYSRGQPKTEKLNSLQWRRREREFYRYRR